MYLKNVLLFFGLFLLIFPVTGFALALIVNHFKDKAEDAAFAEAQATQLDRSGHRRI